MNPELEVHTAYTTKFNPVAEYQRVAFTKMRLSAHDLAIEKGRWSRTPREERKCTCNRVQTESHVLCECPLTMHIRECHKDIASFELPALFDEAPKDVCALIYKCLSVY